MDIVTLIILGVISTIIIVYKKNRFDKQTEANNGLKLLLRDLSKVCEEICFDIDRLDKEVSLIKKEQGITKPIGKGSHWAVKRALKATNDNSGKEIKTSVKNKHKSKKRSRPSEKPFQ